MIAVPEACLGAHQAALEAALRRLAERTHPGDEPHRAEAISLVVWDPQTAAVLEDRTQTEALRPGNFSASIEAAYTRRYAGDASPRQMTNGHAMHSGLLPLASPAQRAPVTPAGP